MPIVVVIVEDNRDIAELQALALTGVVDSVQIVSQEFERILQPDIWQGATCAVLDLMLPHIDGEDICRYLRVEFPHIRRVICTAKPLRHVPDLAELADVVLVKPFIVSDLIRAVTDVPR